MDATERALLEGTFRAALADAGANADGVLAELGWLEMLAAETDDAIGIVFDALGASNAGSSALDDVFASALGTTPRPDLAVLLPAYGSWEQPGALGLATARIVTAREVLIAGRLVPTADVDVRPVRGIDPEGGWHAVQATLAVPAAGDALDPAAWESALARGRRAVAHEIAGASRAMLALAVEHARGRVQFGRPIASFQAVRHHLADALVAVEALDATLRAAADEPGPLTAALAKATAGRTARTVAAQCQQVLAGIGFTTDHPFHRLLKRTMFLEGVFGSADDLAVHVGRELLAARRVPTLIEL